MFKLDAAIKNWRTELIANPSISEEDATELTAHIEDLVEELRQQNLSAEESFWIAKHRMGAPSVLQGEFSKINQPLVWRQRIIWLLLGYFFFTAARSLIDLVLLPIHLVDAQWLLVETPILGPDFSIPLPLFLVALTIVGGGIYLVTTDRGSTLGQVLGRSKILSRLRLARNFVFTFLGICLLLMASSFMSMFYIANMTDMSTIGSVAASRSAFSLLWNVFLFGSLATLAFLTLRKGSSTKGELEIQ